MKSVKKRLGSAILAVIMILSAVPFTSAGAITVDTFTKVSDDTTLRPDEAFMTSTQEDGRVWTNKAVTTDGDFSLYDLSSNVSLETGLDEFGVGLSTLAQGFPTNEHNEEKINVVFTIDVSTSMQSNYMDDGRSRLEILQDVASDFVDELATLGDMYDVHLAIVTYAGIAAVKKTWYDLDSSNKATIKNVLTGIRTFPTGAKDGGNTNTQSGAYLTRLLFEDDYATVYNRPANFNDANTNNFVIFMTDGAPNRYYINGTDEIGSFPLSDNCMYTLNEGISRTIKNTDYKKMAAYKLIEQTQTMTTIPNSTVFSLGLGEWFVESNEFSNFPTGTYLCQLMAASANSIRNPIDNEPITADYCWDNYLGYDVPDGAMQGNNPAFPEMRLTASNYSKGGQYVIDTKDGSYSFSTMTGLMTAVGSPTDTRFHVKVANGRDADCAHPNLASCGIPAVTPELLAQVPFYYAGNTAERFEQSVKDIATVISNSFTAIVTDVSNTDNPDLDGHVSFYDTLGDGMELRSFEGVEIDGQFLSGADFAGFFSNATEASRRSMIVEYFDYFNRVFGESVTAEELYDLFMGAYAAGDIYYNSAEDYGSNIKWYSGSNAQTYLGSYYGIDGSVNAVPAGSVEIVTQHMMLGEAISRGLPVGHAKTTYLFIAVSENIADASQCVHFRVPSSLIPVRTIISSSSQATLQYGSMWPTTLFYKVGLNSNNTEETMSSHLVTENESTFYRFYSNEWKTAAQVAADSSDTTYATYTASYNNPYYHSVEGMTPLYISDGNGGYVQATENVSGTYYFNFTWTDTTGTYTEYLPVLDYFASDRSVPVADAATGVSYKYLDDCILRRDTEIEQTQAKAENTSSTNGNYYASTFEHDAVLNNVTATAYLGNNGVLEFERQSITVNDMVVADYGLDIGLDVLVNDNFPQQSSPAIAGVAPITDKLNTAQVYIKNPIKNEAKTAKAENGTMSVQGDELVFDITSSEFHSENKVYYSCSYTEDGMTYYCVGTATVIPATNMYYEQDFLSLENSWSTMGETASTRQDGASSYIYGRDSQYDTTSGFSNGSALKSTVTMAQYSAGGVDWPTAEFTFYGTAFDLISYTGASTGLLSVTVTDLDTGKAVKKLSVNTHYESNLHDNFGDLYQIPVIYCNIGTYGHYRLTIKAAYHPFFDLTGNDSYDVYLDAIRIYNPAGLSLTKGEVYDAYAADGELNPTYCMLRDKLVTADDAFSTLNNATGAMYVEKRVNTVEGTETESGGFNTVSVATYSKNGPNHEIYLQYGNAIAFSIDDFDALKTVHISAKSPVGEPAVLSVNGTTVKTVSTRTSMYYDITEYIAPDGSVVISNLGQGLLSVCNLKVSEISAPLMMVASTKAFSMAEAVLTAPVEKAPVLSDTLSFDVVLSVTHGDSVTAHTVSVTADTEGFEYALDENNKWYVSFDTNEFASQLDMAVSELYPDALIVENTANGILHLEAQYDGEWVSAVSDTSYNIVFPESTEEQENENQGESENHDDFMQFIKTAIERIFAIFDILLALFR